MDQKLIAFARRYTTAVRRHLKQGAGAGMRPALALGRAAAGLGVDTLGLARIHELALASPELAASKREQIKQAAAFFAEANLPIEESHRASQPGQAHLDLLKKTLSRRNEELAASHRQLERGIVRRKVMEDSFKKRSAQHKKCLEESLALQKRLRQLTHRVLAAQEDERSKISHELQDEIAQTLLGINVRLLTLKREAGTNNRGLKLCIASTRRLVARSTESVRRVGRELGRL